MGVTNKLANATPWDLEIPYTAGVTLFVPADGTLDLTMAQMDDYIPGKPGSQVNRDFLTSFGAFLVDSDRSYENQVLECLRGCISARRQQLQEFTTNLRDKRIATGSPLDETTLAELKRASGYDKLEEKLEVLKKRAELYEKALAQEEKVKPRGTLDPEKTCFATNPPKIFPSKTALKVFLAENPALAEKQKEMLTQMLGKAKKNEPEQHSV